MRFQKLWRQIRTVRPKRSVGLSVAALCYTDLFDAARPIPKNM